MTHLKSALRTLALAACVGGLLTLAACGGGGGGGDSAPVVPTLQPVSTDTPPPAPSPTSENSMTVIISRGVNSAPNLPMVSLQLCAPGTRTCQTIDNVLVDTGSTGVRIAASVLDPALLAALPRESVEGVPLAACQQFIESATWGTMRVADIALGPKSASAQPLQIVGDPAAGDTPASCTDNDALPLQNSPEQLGTNGIVGVSAALYDCGSTCAQTAVAGTYYACREANACEATLAPIALQSRNPVADFADDNNGVVLNLPAIAAQGQGTTLGTLYFGVGTRANNTLRAATVLRNDPDTMRFTASYNGDDHPESFIDSGSNYLFFNDSSIARCPAGGSFAAFYCPTEPLALTAHLPTTSGTWLDTALSVANAQALFTNNPDVAAFDNVAMSSTGTAIDFGLPFFYGKLVAVLNEGETALGENGPFTALASP